MPSAKAMGRAAEYTPQCRYSLFRPEKNVKECPIALQAGTVLNNRDIMGRFGQSCFGIMYLAWVAVKEFMSGEIATCVGGTAASVMMETCSKEFAYGVGRFLEEAWTLAKFIGNLNIAGVSSYFDENDTSYFVMDHII